MWTTDFWMGAIWTLLCVVVGGLVVLVLVAVVGDRPPDDGDEDDDPLGIAPDDFDLDAWLDANRIVLCEPFEANLLRR